MEIVGNEIDETGILDVLRRGSSTEDEKKVYEVLKKNMHKSMSEIQPYVPYGKTKITKILKQMAKKV